MSTREIRPLARTSATRAELVDASGLRRVLRLSGAVGGTVELDLRNERRQLLLVNGEPVWDCSALLGYLSVFPFHLPSQRGRVPATLEVDVHLWHAIRAVRLRIRRQVVYSEGVFPGAEPGQVLPIPADAASEGLAGLPAPSMLASPAPEALPLAAAAQDDPLPSLLLRRQRWARAWTIAALAVTAASLGGGIAGVIALQERQRQPSSATIRYSPSRPKHRPGPYRPATDPSPDQLRGR